MNDINETKKAALELAKSLFWDKCPFFLNMQKATNPEGLFLSFQEMGKFDEWTMLMQILPSQIVCDDRVHRRCLIGDYESNDFYIYYQGKYELFHEEAEFESTWQAFYNILNLIAKSPDNLIFKWSEV